MPPHPAIKHIVVLMMENRSFDHVLGLMKAENGEIRGVLGNDYINFAGSGAAVPVSDGAAYQGQLTIDPGHEFVDVHTQMYGLLSGTSATEPDMSGFVRNYEQLGGAGPNVMKCFRPEQVPNTSELARHYAICDQWFSSVPGPTLPNRAFAHFGTSFGRLDMSPDYFRAKSSIYQRLKLAGKKGRIYYYSKASGTLGLTFLLSDQRDYFRLWGDFKNDCQNDRLPDYSFIEPNYAEQPGVLANDQHPDHSVREGDRFIKQVYDAIRSNDAVWQSSVLIVVWDEHGGIFDHEVPPIVTHPDGFTSTTPVFAFDRLGVRVPALIVSPFVEKGVVDHTSYEHASIPASATEQFIGEPRQQALYAREQFANTIRHLLTRNTPRNDDPDFAASALAAPAHAPQARTAEPASSLHLDQVRQIYTVLRRTHPIDALTFDPAAVTTEEEAGQFIQRALDIIHPDPVPAGGPP